MKKLNKTAFILLMIGIITLLAYSLVNYIISFIQGADFSEFEDLGQDFVNSINNMFIFILIFGFVITLLLYGYFLFRLVKNNKKPAKQGYLIVLLVLTILGLFFNIISLIGKQFIVLINIAIEVVILVGCYKQLKYEPVDNNQNYINPSGSNPNDSNLSGSGQVFDI